MCASRLSLADARSTHGPQPQDRGLSGICHSRGSQVTLAAFIEQTYTWRRENLPLDVRRTITPNQIKFTGFVGINLLRRYCNRAGHLSSSASEALTKIGLPGRISVSQPLFCGRGCGQNALLAQLALTDDSVESHFGFTYRPMCLTFSKRQRRSFPGRTSSVLLPGKASMPWSTGASRLESRRSRQITQQEYNTTSIIRRSCTAALSQRVSVSSYRDVPSRRLPLNGCEPLSLFFSAESGDVLTQIMGSAPTTPIWTYEETVPPPFEGHSPSVIPAEVQVPSLGSFQAGTIEVKTYAPEVLLMHALSRLIDAEQILRSVDSHSASRNSRHRWQHAHEAWAHAMLELVLLYDMHIAAQNAIEEDRNAPISPGDRAEARARSQRKRRLELGADLSESAEAVFDVSSRLFLDVYDFLRHTPPSRVAQDLVHFIRTTCKIEDAPPGDQDRWLLSIAHLAGEVLLFLKDKVSPGPA